ncbi:hypothetical protein M0R72_01110 [Candidatus Pacearchaeota archaeon]|jgi:hypothetical protein|nr:hypothetical protein [Candidatus Pacearchaeota archaeon]
MATRKKVPTSTNPNPPPPKVGTVIKGRSDIAPCEVRAVVDHVKDDMYGHLYQLVVRSQSIKHPGSYSYSLVDAHAIGLGLYVVVKGSVK